MAFVVEGNGAGYFATVTVMDTGEETATLTVSLRSADEATAEIDMTTWITNFRLVSKCEVVGYNLQRRFVNNAIAVPAAAQIQEKARVAYRLADTSKYETLDIPAPQPTIFMDVVGAASEIVDVTDTQLLNYTNLYKAAGIAFISDGEDLESISRGERVSTRKGMRRGK